VKTNKRKKKNVLKELLADVVKLCWWFEYSESFIQSVVATISILIENDKLT
jgi:hypothetical protein